VLSRRRQLRRPVPQNDFIDDVATLYATHRHKPVTTKALPDIHTAFIDQESAAAEASAGIVLSNNRSRSGFAGERKASRRGGIHTVLLSS